MPGENNPTVKGQKDEESALTEKGLATLALIYEGEELNACGILLLDFSPASGLSAPAEHLLPNPPGLFGREMET